MKVVILILSLIIFVPLAKAQVQSHPLSEITPIDTNLDMFGYNITNVSYIGIGLTSPAYPLHVTGDIYTTGAFRGEGTYLTGTALSLTAGGVSCTGCIGSTQVADLDASDITTGIFSVERIPVLDYTKVGSLYGENITYGTIAVGRLPPEVVLTTGSYADPSWITSLDWSKIINRNLNIVWSGELGWGNLTDYPSGCPAGQAVQVIGDSLTCIDLSQYGNVTGTGSAGQIAFWTGTSSISGDNSLYWDNTNKRLGIGTTSPIDRLHVVGNVTISDRLNLTEVIIKGGSETNYGGTSYPNVLLVRTPDDTSSGRISVSDLFVSYRIWGSTSSGPMLQGPFRTYSWSLRTVQGSLLFDIDTGSSNSIFRIQTENAAGTPIERLRITNLVDTANFTILNSNVGIGTTSPGAKLHIKGSPGGLGEIRLTHGDRDDYVRVYADQYGNIRISGTTIRLDNPIYILGNIYTSGARKIGAEGSNTFIKTSWDPDRHKIEFYASLPDGTNPLIVARLYDQSFEIERGKLTGNLDANNYNITNINYLGIGTTSPAYKLDIAGTLRASAGNSNLKVENGDIIVEV